MKVRLGYRLFKRFVRFLHDHLLYRKKYIIGLDTLPAKGEPFLVPANHNNTAIDPIAMVLSQPQSVHPYVLAMGGVFTWSKWINMIWDWVGMLPAFRIDFEGMDEALKRTKYVVDFAAEKMVDGNPVMLFPEANHHDEHWMRTWQVGYLEIAFLAAEKMNFEKDVKIVPMAHHYSSYYGAQGSYMLHYAEPISLMPYYEQYKAKPRTTMREINHIFRDSVKSMMLYTDNIEQHDLFDFIRLGKIGNEYAGEKCLPLPEQLKSDQRLWADLDAALLERPEMVEPMTDTMNTILKEEKALCLRPHAAEKHRNPNAYTTLLSLLCQIILLPLWLVALFPNAIFYYIPPMFMPGKEDRYYLIYTQAMQLIVSILVLIPLSILATILVLGLVWGWWWQAVVWILLWYPLGLFAWYEGTWMRNTFERLQLLTHKKQAKRLVDLYNRFYQQVNTFIGKK